MHQCKACLCYIHNYKGLNIVLAYRKYARSILIQPLKAVSWLNRSTDSEVDPVLTVSPTV